MPGDVSLSGIEFTIKGETDNATNSIDKLISKLSALNDALSKDNGLSKLKSNLTGLKKALGEIKNADIKGAVKNLKHLGELGKSLQGLANISKDLASFMRALSKLSESPENVLDLAQALNTLGSVDLTNLQNAEGALRALADALAALSKSTKAATPEKHVLSWKKLGSVLSDVWKKGIKPVGKFALKALAFPFKQAGKTVADFVKPLKDTLAGFKRILGYRIIRSIIKEIGQAFQVGIQNLYNWSVLVNGRFASSMDMIATSMQYFKNSLGAAVAPIVNALAPAVDFLIDKIVALINVINQLFAKLTGAASWTKAIKKAKDYGEAVGGAGGKAKEALRYLAPFDELNRLPDDNKGGGGGGSGDDFSGMFEDVTEFGSAIADFADSIKEKVEAGDWKGLGELLGGKVNELIASIDFAGIGTKIGGYINAWFTTKYWTLKETNFQAIGAKISEFLFGDGKDKKGVIGSIDWDTFGKSIAQKFTILPDIIIGALDGIDFTKLGEAIGKFVGGISEEFTNWLNTINWEQKGKDLVQDIVDMFSGLKDAGTAEKVAGFFTALWNAVKGLLTGIWKAAFNGETYTQPVDVNLSFSKSSLTTPKTAKIPTISLSDALTALTAGLLVYTITGNLVAASIVASLTLGFTSSHLDFEEIKDADAKTIQDYIKNLDEQFKDAKPGTYEYQYYQHFKSAAETKLKEAAEAGGSAFHQSLEDGFSGRSGKFGFGEVKIPVTAKAVQIQDELTPTQKTFDTKAKFTSRKNSLSDKEKQFNTVADFKSRVNDLSDKAKKFDTVANFNSRLNGLSDKEKKFSTVANFDSSKNNLGTPAFSSLAAINKYNVKDSLKTADGFFNLDTKIKVVGQDGTPTIKAKIATTTISPTANGGAYYGNSWHSIPQYANGGRVHGSMFIAGEAGAELVGHVGGRTEVLNQSQLAATMYAAVSNALHGLHMVISAPSASGSMNDSLMDEETMYRAFSRALADSDLGGDIELDGNTLYRAMVNRNRQNTRLTGVNAMA